MMSEKEKERLCTACDHTFHAGRCFYIMTVGRNLIECRCKKRIA